MVIRRRAVVHEYETTLGRLGDLFAYRCAASAENEDVEIAFNRSDGLLNFILQELQASSYSFYISGPTNFRFQAYPEYKANRANLVKPRHLEEVRQFLVREHGALISDNCEADDMMAIAQSAQTAREPTTIVSLDKDMLQVPGWHYSWRIEGGKPEKRWVKDAIHQEISPIEGFRKFYYQMLVGDTTDNIKGANGVGKVKAAALLAHEDLDEWDMFNIVRAQYSNDIEMLMNGEVIWLQRNVGETFKSTDHGKALLEEA